LNFFTISVFCDDCSESLLAWINLIQTWKCNLFNCTFFVWNGMTM
jgi:hypothetical protein